MSIRKILDCSTWHLTRNDAYGLDSVSLSNVFPTQHGCLFYIGLENPERDAEWRECGMSESFFKLLAYARRQGCEFIFVDSDGELLDEEPAIDTHHW